MIEVKKLNKTYDKDYYVLQDISFVLPDSGLVVISGESGSGKTTLLNCLQGLENYSGEIIFDNVLMTKTNVADIRKEYFSMVYQDYQLIENMTVEANLRIASECIGNAITSETIQNLLASVKLDKNYIKKNCQEMSGGEKQRIAIARALVQESKIILADEPTGNLDSSNSEIIWQILKNLSKEKLVIIVTHNMEQASLYADHFIELSDNKCKCDNIFSDASKKCIIDNSGKTIASCHVNKTNNRKTKLSFASTIDLLKWINKDKFLTILLSVFSVILLITSMVMNAFCNVEYNDLVFKNINYNPEHIIGFETNDKIDREIVSDINDVAFGYTLNEEISFNGTQYEGTPRPNAISKLYSVRGTSYVIESSDVSKLGIKLKYGHNSTNVNEIVISEYFARNMVYSKFLYNGKLLETEKDVLDITLSNGLTIVGIVDTNLDAKIKKFSLPRADYTFDEVGDLDTDSRSEFQKMELFIKNTLDTSLIFIAEGYAKAKGIDEENCRGAYLSSKNVKLERVYEIFNAEESLNIKMNSLYTYGMDKIVDFFDENKMIFTIVMVSMSILSVVFVAIVAFLTFKNKVNDLLILRSLNINKYIISALIFLSQALLLLLEIIIAAGINMGVIALLNGNFAKVLTQAFKTLFFDWKFIVYLGLGCLASIALHIIHVLTLFKKPINYHKQK